MARPRTIDADCIQTFHCNYVLRTALMKSAAANRNANVSSFVRTSLETACELTLGHDQWMRLQSAADRQIRRTALEAFLAKIDLTRIRRVIDQARGKTVSTNVGDMVIRAIDDYVRSLELARDQEDVDLLLAVALEEAIDIIQKMKTMLLRPSLTKSALEQLQLLAARFPDPLRADFDAAILSRVVASQVDPA